MGGGRWEVVAAECCDAIPIARRIATPGRAPLAHQTLTLEGVVEKGLLLPLLTFTCLPVGNQIQLEMELKEEQMMSFLRPHFPTHSFPEIFQLHHLQCRVSSSTSPVPIVWTFVFAIYTSNPRF